MIIDGSLQTLNINGSFDMKDENGDAVFQVSRNKFIPDKVYIKSLESEIEYLGETVFDAANEEFVLYEDDSEILKITHLSSLGAPKFNIVSPYGDYTVKFYLRKRSFVLSNGSKEVLTLTGSSADYVMDIDDNCNIFYVMSIAYGITLLLDL